MCSKAIIYMCVSTDDTSYPITLTIHLTKSVCDKYSGTTDKGLSE